MGDRVKVKVVIVLIPVENHLLEGLQAIGVKGNKLFVQKESRIILLLGKQNQLMSNIVE